MRSDNSPPGPRGRPLIGNLLDFRRDPPGFLLNCAREYGEVVHLRFGPQDIYLIDNPQYIRDVLVTNNRNFKKSRGLQMAKKFLGEGMLTSEGEFHLRQRRLSQPAFHAQRIDAYANVMADYARRASDRWKEGETIEIGQEMMRLTLAIVGKTLFDSDVESEAKEIGRALTQIMEMFNRITTPFPQLLEKLPLPSNRRFIKARERLDETIYRFINERRRTGEDRGDLLSMLLLATDTEGDQTGMTDEQLRDEAMTLFLAGHETTANALTWAWYLLSQNPDAEARLHKEVDALPAGRLPLARDYPALKYTEMVFAEALRLYPPAWTIGRQALGDYIVGPYLIPAGSIILMSQWVTHHNAAHFPDPFKFDPERWTDQARQSRPKFSYFPFGGGPRVCIGESFAWMEGVLVLATIARRWGMRLAPGQVVEPQARITLRPKHGVRMVIGGRATPLEASAIANS